MGRLKSNGHMLRLRIAGYEEREKDLERARAQLEEAHLEEMCQLVGTVRGAEKAALLNEADVFVLPSYQEGLPMAILEAMAAGLAIVATPVGGIPEVVQDGYNGFLVAPGDIGALSEKLAILVGDPQLRELMGRRSRRFAEEQLDVRSYADRLVDLYDSLTKV
jgi:glycosyltransferase involved in cell wall biosynthesis